MIKNDSLAVIALLVGAAFLGRNHLTAQTPAEAVHPLEGVWKATSIETSGVRVSDEALPEVYVAFTKSDYLAAGATGPIVGKYSTHSAGSKRAIDIVYLSGPDKGKTGRLLYEVTGDKLRIYGPLVADSDRPNQFPQGGALAGHFLAEHVRIKK